MVKLPNGDVLTGEEYREYVTSNQEKTKHILVQIADVLKEYENGTYNIYETINIIKNLVD